MSSNKDDIILIESPNKRKNNEIDSVNKRIKNVHQAGRPQESAVWKYFQKVNVKDAKCLIEDCPQSKRLIKTENHANVKKHLKNYHEEIHEKVMEIDKRNIKEKNIKDQTKITEMFQPKELYKPNEYRQIHGEKLLSYFLCSTKFPYYLLKITSFRNFINFLDAKFKIPGLIKVNNHSVDMEFQMISKIKSLVKDCEFLTCATDLWTTKNMSNSFMALTCNFYDKNSNKAFDILLGLELINEKHSSENIKKVIQKLYLKYEIENENVLRIITDNGSNMVKCFNTILTKQIIRKSIDDVIEEVIKEKSDKESMIINLEDQFELTEEVTFDDEIDWIQQQKRIANEIKEFESKEKEENLINSKNFRIPYYAHTLQLIVNSIYNSKELFELSSKVKQLAHKINKSTCAIRKLKTLCNTKPPGFCHTRWSSLFILLNWVNNNQSSIRQFCESFSYDHLTVNEWGKVKQIVVLLKPFAEFTTLIQSSNVNTLSIIIPSLKILGNHLSKFRNNFFLINQ